MAVDEMKPLFPIAIIPYYTSKSIRLWEVLVYLHTVSILHPWCFVSPQNLA